MRKTKLIRFLATLDEEEFKAFKKFVHSPFHNSNKQATLLLEALSNYHPDYEAPTLTKKAVYTKIHPKDKPYHEGRMNQLMTQLLGLIKQFFAFHAFQKDTFQQRKLKLSAYRLRRLDKAFFQEADQILRSAEEQPMTKLEAFLAHRTLFFHPATPRYQVGMESLDGCLRGLDAFYLEEKLRFTALALNRARILNESYDIKLLDALQEEFGAAIEQSPLLRLYRDIIQVQLTEDQPLMKKLADNLEEILPYLNTEEQQNIVALLLNILAQQHRKGQEYLKKALFHLYKMGLDSQLFTEDGVMPAVIFINCVSISSANGAFKWAKAFMEEYRPMLKPEEQPDTVNLALAYLHYHQAAYQQDRSSYSKVIDYINNTSFSNVYSSYQARSLLLRAYYELYMKQEDHVDFLLDFTYAFQRHIARNHSLEPTKAATFANFIKHSRALIKLRWDRDINAEKADRIKTAIEQEENLFARSWLLEKTGELL